MAKKEFGNFVTDEVSRPVTEHKERREASVNAGKRAKVNLDDSNATKRTFYIRHDILQQFNLYCVTHNIDKGALVNIALSEFMNLNADRKEFDI